MTVPISNIISSSHKITHTTTGKKNFPFSFSHQNHLSKISHTIPHQIISRQFFSLGTKSVVTIDKMEYTNKNDFSLRINVTENPYEKPMVEYSKSFGSPYNYVIAMPFTCNALLQIIFDLL